MLLISSRGLEEALLIIARNIDPDIVILGCIEILVKRNIYISMFDCRIFHKN
jgi:hypothetical protein